MVYAPRHGVFYLGIYQVCDGGWLVVYVSQLPFFLYFDLLRSFSSGICSKDQELDVGPLFIYCKITGKGTVME